MEKEKLHRFFAGTTSIQEGMDIRAWMEASEENKRIFYKERKLFDALMVHDDQTTNNCISTKRIPKIIRQWLKIASVIILTLTINYLYQKYKSENEVIAMNTVSVPAGQRTNITLPDGTNVWLNARTTLQYPVTFSQKQRTVFLKGEAYFQVAHDRQKAFVVVTDDIEVKVYGTEFNINTRVADYVQTTLVRGAVSIKTERSAEKMLKPGQLAQFDRLTGETEIKNVDVSNYIGWKSGVYIFEDKSIEQIMDELSLWYDIEVFFRNNISRNRHFSGSLPRYREIDDMLKVIEKTSHVRFEVKGKTIIVD